MPSSLKRVLRIRGMQEEQARMELEAEAARLRGLERLVAEAGCEARASRERWFAAVKEETAGGTGGDAGDDPVGGSEDSGRMAEEASWELAVWRRERAGAQRPEQEVRVARSREEYLGGRRERLQVEALVEAAEVVERREGDHRDQRALDDWYRSRLRVAAVRPMAESDAKGLARETDWPAEPKP